MCALGPDLGTAHGMCGGVMMVNQTYTRLSHTRGPDETPETTKRKVATWMFPLFHPEVPRRLPE